MLTAVLPRSTHFPQMSQIQNKWIWALPILQTNSESSGIKYLKLFSILVELCKSPRSESQNLTNPSSNRGWWWKFRHSTQSKKRGNIGKRTRDMCTEVHHIEVYCINGNWCNPMKLELIINMNVVLWNRAPYRPWMFPYSLATTWRAKCFSSWALLVRQCSWTNNTTKLYRVKAEY